MNSFYGGKQGSSFIIAQTYTTIQEMLDDFVNLNKVKKKRGQIDISQERFRRA